MRRRTLLRGLGAGTGTAALGALAGCTDQGTPGTATDTPTATPTETPTQTDMPQPDVTVAAVDPFGDILVGPDGLTLYLFTQDSGGESSCYEQCAENWPPLTVGESPTAGDGVMASLDTTERDDGTLQVTAAGNPLYYFAGDSEPGETNGQGLGDAWYVLDPAGQAIQSGGPTATGTPTATPTETMSGGGGGGGNGGY